MDRDQVLVCIVRECQMKAKQRAQRSWNRRDGPDDGRKVEERGGSFRLLFLSSLSIGIQGDTK